MKWLEMHNVEFGECIVLGGAEGDILMVDCGSMNTKTREPEREIKDYVEQELMPRYADARIRAFLLTHFHRDHLAGFRQILKKDPRYFQRVLLPWAPADRRGRPLLLEFALYVFAFLGRQTDCSQMSVSALRIFERLRVILGMDAVYTLGAGESFFFDGVYYDVLWPKAQHYPFSPLFVDAVEDLDVCLSSPYIGKCAPLFLELKQLFCREYLRCCALCAPSQRASAERIGASVDRLKELLDELEELSDSLRLLPASQDIAEILSRPAVRAEYANAQNMASLVFHNRRVREASTDDILMTGDATPETFDEIADALYGGYFIFKAPHHGAAGSWSHFFGDISKSHILISNGDYHAGGKICAEYVQDEGIKHCTNSSVCPWVDENGYCCNRIAYCWEASEKGMLTLKCPKCVGTSERCGCEIYVVSAGRDRGCLCDR